MEVRQLTQDEEKELARLIQKGQEAEKELEVEQNENIRVELEKIKNQGEVALEKLLSANVRFISYFVKSYINYGLDYNDLYQAGMLGMLKAAKKFDAERGNKFTTYASNWVKDEVIKALNNEKAIKMPKEVISKVSSFNKKLDEIRSDLSRDPSVDEIVELTGMEKDEVLNLLECNHTFVSLDAEVGDESRVSDFVASDEDTPDEKYMKQSVKNTISTMFDDILNDREVYILKRRFGLDGKESESFAQIGAKINLSAERTRQIYSNTIEKIKASSYMNELATIFYNTNKL